MNLSVSALPRVVVLLSGNGSNFQAIAEHLARTNTGEISCVISNRPQAYGLQRAHALQIPVQVLDHSAYPDRASFDQALAAAVIAAEPDWVVLAGYMRILSPAFVAQFADRLVNIHPSLLPRYKGLHTHQRALADGATEHGCSVHFVTPELDSGAIIAQARVSISANDTEETLSKKVQIQEHQLYPHCVDMLCKGQLQLTADGVRYEEQLLPDQGLDLTYGDT